MSRFQFLRSARTALVAALAIGIVLGAIVGAAAGFFSRSDEVDRLDDRVATLDDRLTEALEARNNADARALELTGEAADLQRDIDAKDVEIATLSAQIAQLTVTNAETLQLRADLDAARETRDQLQAQLDAAESDLVTIRIQRDEALSALSELVPINSLNISPDPLRFDPSSPTQIIRALCTGSMEPTIGCSDSLLVYKPSQQDLDVGDIIVFWQPTSDCSSVTVGAGILHRIVQIVRSSDGQLAFRTQGDALLNRDPCPVPFDAVVSKVAAIVFDASLDSN
jgi:signal peptidase I